MLDSLKPFRKNRLKLIPDDFFLHFWTVLNHPEFGVFL